MTDTQIYAWIFLSVSDQPTSLQNVIALADWLNHAIPSHKELQAGFGWLQAQGLVKKEGNYYSLTDKGIALYKSISHGNRWDNVVKKFSKLPAIDFQLDDITKEEVDTAYELYSAQAKKIMRELGAKRKKSK